MSILWLQVYVLIIYKVANTYLKKIHYVMKKFTNDIGIYYIYINTKNNIKQF